MVLPTETGLLQFLVHFPHSELRVTVLRTTLAFEVGRPVTVRKVCDADGVLVEASVCIAGSHEDTIGLDVSVYVIKRLLHGASLVLRRMR